MLRMWSWIRYRGILRRWSQIRYRCILSMRIGIDACDDGCIRFRENRSRRIVRDGSGNLWVRCRGNNSTIIERARGGCWKNFRGRISSGDCWNRCRVRDMCTPSSLVPDSEGWCSSVLFFNVFASPKLLLPVLGLFSISIGLPCFVISVLSRFSPSFSLLGFL